MAQVAGITFEQTYNGIPRYVRIDLKRWGNQLQDFFDNNNIAVTTNDLKNPAITGILPKGYVTLDEFSTNVHKSFKDYCEKHGLYKEESRK